MLRTILQFIPERDPVTVCVTSGNLTLFFQGETAVKEAAESDGQDRRKQEARDDVPPLVTDKPI